MAECGATYAERPLREYLADAASGQPTPGGGSVSALAGALGTSMASMAANFTVGRPKYAAVEPEVRSLLATLDGARARLMAATQRDIDAYAGVSAARGLPKGSDAERAARRQAVQEALGAAIAPPLEAMRAAREALGAARRLAEIANPNLITDVGVAGILLDAAVRGAHLNVAVNLDGMKDAERLEQVRRECGEILRDAARLAAEIAAAVGAALAGKAG